MRNRGQIIFGSLLLFFGLVLILGNIFHINIWAVCWPTGLILVGIWFLLRPRLNQPGSGINISPLANIRRYGSWTVRNEETWIIVGDIKLDMTQAEIPLGETTIHSYGFVGDVRLIVPQGIGLSITSTAFLTDAKILGQKGDHFFIPVYYTSENYATAERKVRLETLYFVIDLDVEQP
jgi:lia operon protein LiaF